MSEKITVKIIDSYAFEHDRFGYTLFEVGKREKGVFGSPDKQQKTGELVDYKETVGYYSNVTSMLEDPYHFTAITSTESVPTIPLTLHPAVISFNPDMNDYPRK